MEDLNNLSVDSNASQPEKQEHTQEPPELSLLESLWERVTRMDLVDPFVRVGTLVASLTLIFLLLWGLRVFYLRAALQGDSQNSPGILGSSEATPTPVSDISALPPLQLQDQQDGVRRVSDMDTNIPTRARVDVISYTVEAGDSIFGIAEKFNIRPETVLWANTSILNDNPHRIQPGQELNIMPVDGTYHKWREGENFRKVAEFYGVDPQDVVEWPGNPFDLFDNNIDNLAIEPGTMLIIPGGSRELIDYGPPRIPRSNPAVARTYGPGHCGELTEGVIGDGLFIWPTPEHYVGGYDYNPTANHPAIDIAGNTGHSIFAADDGVVVYSGWSNLGYGNLIVLDHGNDWQTLYAHLDAVYVGCGESIYQGATIGTMGVTGNSSGPHLHFVMAYAGAKVNPHNFLP